MKNYYLLLGLILVLPLLAFTTFAVIYNYNNSTSSTSMAFTAPAAEKTLPGVAKEVLAWINLTQEYLILAGIAILLAVAIILSAVILHRIKNKNKIKKRGKF